MKLLQTVGFGVVVLVFAGALTFGLVKATVDVTNTITAGLVALHPGLGY